MLGLMLLAAISSERPVHGEGEGHGEGDPLTVLKREFKDLPELIRGKRVLDFGCGLGIQSAAMAEMGADVTGLDINLATLERARRAHPHIRFVSEVQDETFDVVVNQNAFEHFQPPKPVLMSMLRAVRPGGKLLLTFGPPWYAPHGAHMHFFCRLPWFHLLFSESAIMRVRSKYRSDGAERFGEVESGLNQMSIAKFERLTAGLNVTRRHYLAVKGQQWLTKIPWIRELAINHVTVVIEP